MNEPARIWKTGERCRITYAGRTIEGKVELASPNGKSIAVRFDAILGGFVEVICALYDDDSRCFRDLMFHARVELADIIQA